MTEGQIIQLRALSDYLNSRREVILLAWRQAAKADPEQTTARSLTRGQFNDHIPQVLDAFQNKLSARPGGMAEQDAKDSKKEEEVKHGLHRWQQGYRLLELMHEWGHLQRCLFEEIETYAAAHPAFERSTLTEANRQMIDLVNEAIGESAGQYERLQRAEATGRLGDLEKALAGVNELDRRRTTLIHQAVHDLRTNVQSVSSAAQILSAADLAEAERVEFARLLQQGVESVSTMLGELMELARLEAGQERRQNSLFDVAALMKELCQVNLPLARERGLFLTPLGPAQLQVTSDASKVRRIAQNLVMNALKYTITGGVTVSWGEERENWWLMIKDTGPGLLSGPGAPMLLGLKEATASARESDQKTAESRGEISHVLSNEGSASPARPPQQQTGEGIGLSIVKRLCELLDASLELASSPGKGSTFRVVFPRSR